MQGGGKSPDSRLARYMTFSKHLGLGHGSGSHLAESCAHQNITIITIITIRAHSLRKQSNHWQHPIRQSLSLRPSPVVPIGSCW